MSMKNLNEVDGAGAMVELLISGMPEGKILNVTGMIDRVSEALPMFKGRAVDVYSRGGIVDYYWVKKGSRGEQKVVVFASGGREDTGAAIELSERKPLRVKVEMLSVDDSRKAAMTLASRLSLEGVQFVFQETSLSPERELVVVVESPLEYIHRVGFSVGGFDQPYVRRSRPLKAETE